MKIRYTHGNQAGSEADVDLPTAQNAVDSGFAVYVEAPAAPAPVVEVEQAPTPEPERASIGLPPLDEAPAVPPADAQPEA